MLNLFNFFVKVLNFKTPKYYVRQPYYRISSVVSKSPIRPFYRGKIMKIILKPWCLLAIFHSIYCYKYDQSFELPILRTLVWLSTINNIFISDKYHNSDLAPNPSIKLELFYLRCDFTGISFVLASTNALWSAHFKWNFYFDIISYISTSCFFIICYISFVCFERGKRCGANSESSEKIIKLLFGIQYIVCFGYMVFCILQTPNCGIYSLTWFLYLPGIIFYVLQWPEDGLLIGAHDVFHIFSLFGNLLSAWFDVIHTQNACRLK